MGPVICVYTSHLQMGQRDAEERVSWDGSGPRGWGRLWPFPQLRNQAEVSISDTELVTRRGKSAMRETCRLWSRDIACDIYIKQLLVVYVFF